ncbi:GNAT family N-acetyltransferase [Jeotgalibacillus proteolyticus]|uniref:GNAT family N-acetyltransferase n=1 Tax=Jeotgalibacillus proteolyticus TaxID=2082395 RepID=A0A2S5G957_9BACL|nr:GNAT family N-acetyltransferase [Jeotgalibacillus proteolyticus]PPA69526.1 GNAT family N-acetyltransferase [Jeotgalibacillus proteolyticus]
MTSEFSVMDFEIITERLSMRLWEEMDASWYRELVGERGVDEPTFEEACERVMSLRASALENGISLLPIRRKDEGDIIGYCGLIIGRSTLEEPEIAYELFKRAHGKGYATEAASAIIEAAAATGRKRLWATVGSWNRASFRVLEKIGFTRQHSTWKDDGEEIVWNMRELSL